MFLIKRLKYFVLISRRNWYFFNSCYDINVMLAIVRNKEKGTEWQKNDKENTIDREREKGRQRDKDIQGRETQKEKEKEERERE